MRDFFIVRETSFLKSKGGEIEQVYEYFLNKVMGELNPNLK